MSIKSEAIIYKIIEKHLKESENPLSCTDLWNFTDVQLNAKSVEKVSDALGLMWRRRLIQRWNVPLSSVSKSRYAHTWIEHNEAPKAVEAPSISLVRNAYKKTNVTVTEDGDKLILDFDKFTMTFQSKV